MADHPDPEFADFLSALAHDFRTPLTSIRGFADVLLTRGDQLHERERADYLERIKVAAERLDGLITELSAAAKERST